MAFKYPEAKRDETVVDNYHGTEVPDPYRWLEDPDAPETIAFVDAQNAVTQPYINSCKYKSKIKEILTKTWNYPRLGPPQKHGNKYFQFRNTGLQNQSVMYVMDTLGLNGTVFLDANSLSSDGTISLADYAFSEDGETLAYALSTNGADWREIRFKSTKTGEDYPDVLKKVKFSSLSWHHNHKHLFYSGYAHTSGRSDGCETNLVLDQMLYLHCLGTDQCEDKVVFKCEDHQMRIGHLVTHCGKYFLTLPSKGCKNNLVYYTELPSNLDELELPIKPVPIVSEFNADYEYITNRGKIFYFRTNYKAPNYCIVKINLDNPDPSKWETLISQTEDVLDSVSLINNNMLVVSYIHMAKDNLSLYCLDTASELHRFEQDIDVDLVSLEAISGKHDHSEMFFAISSILTALKIYRVEIKGRDNIKTTLFHETEVKGFDPLKFTSYQLTYQSKDGVSVPIFVAHKIEPDVFPRPCILYGYGGFNMSIAPSFSNSRLPFLDNFNGVYAIANIRGGGEFGEAWHNAGRYENKQNTFDDFNAAARFLIDNKFTTSDMITIFGSSNGGLTVTACINQDPALYGAALSHVGVTDMLRFHKFTIGYAWTSDYGCSDDPEHFKNLYKYSPVHNINKPAGTKQYPATLLRTADHDDRVVPLHSLKYIAELQHQVGDLPQQTKPLMISIQTKTGHGMGKPLSKQIDEVTDDLCFIQKALNLEFHTN